MPSPPTTASLGITMDQTEKPNPLEEHSVETVKIEPDPVDREGGLKGWLTLAGACVHRFSVLTKNVY